MITAYTSAWTSTLLVMLLVLPSQTEGGSDPDYYDPLEQGNTNTVHAESQASYAKNTKMLIITLSVVIGVVVLVSVSLSIIYALAQRRQWSIRESLSRSARRVTRTLKAPFTREAPSTEILPPRSRSLRGMTKLQSPRTVEILENRHVQNQSGCSDEIQHKMPWEWGGGHQDKNTPFDLERGIELASTGTMKITVSTADSSRSDSPSRTGWRGIFALGRQ